MGESPRRIGESSLNHPGYGRPAPALDTRTAHRHRRSPAIPCRQNTAAALRPATGQDRLVADHRQLRRRTRAASGPRRRPGPGPGTVRRTARGTLHPPSEPAHHGRNHQHVALPRLSARQPPAPPHPHGPNPQPRRRPPRRLQRSHYEPWSPRLPHRLLPRCSATATKSRTSTPSSPQTRTSTMPPPSPTEPEQSPEGRGRCRCSVADSVDVCIPPPAPTVSAVDHLRNRWDMPINANLRFTVGRPSAPKRGRSSCVRMSDSTPRLTRLDIRSRAGRAVVSVSATLFTRCR